MGFWRRRSASETVVARLHQRIEECIQRRDATRALENGALAETAEVLDLVLQRRRQGEPLLVGALTDVILVHHLRASELASSEDTHAFVALAVWLHAVNPADVAPQLRHDVAQAVQRGAETDEPTAILRALQGHASAVRAAWLRTHDPALADTFVAVFTRLLDHTSTENAAYPIRLLDLAGAFSARSEVDVFGVNADLDTAIDLAAQSLEHPQVTDATVRRAHKLLGPMLVNRLERSGSRDDFARAQASFKALVDLAADEQGRRQSQRDLAVLNREYGG